MASAASRENLYRSGFVQIPGFPDYMYKPSNNPDFEPEVRSFAMTESDDAHLLKTALVNGDRGYVLYRKDPLAVKSTPSARCELTFKQIHDLCYPCGVPVQYAIVEIHHDDEGDTDFDRGISFLDSHRPYHPIITTAEARGAAERAARSGFGRQFAYCLVLPVESCKASAIVWNAKEE
jgi:hypothetical protein